DCPRQVPHGPVPAPAASRGSPPEAVSAIEPDVVEPRPLRLVIEALELLRGRPEAVQVPVTDRRHLLVPELMHALPERVALLLVRLAPHLLKQSLDVRVARPA